jgi:serine/threonine protein kinase
MLTLEGREIGGCKLIRKIGAGGMGEVYLGEQLRVGNRPVAVKVVDPDEGPSHAEDADAVARRFQREAALLGRLSHPNILPVYDSGVEPLGAPSGQTGEGGRAGGGTGAGGGGKLLYLVMAYAPDGSLADALKGTSKLTLTLPVDLPTAVAMIAQIAAALQYTHDQGIVHRDVKPGNVLIRVEPNGRWHLLLADFGVARGMDSAGQRTQISGTFLYMAPEQFSGTFSPASDQYALAVMAYQLLAGRPPFEGELGALTRAHLYEAPPSPRTFNPAIPPAVEAVLLRALAKDPAQRYPTVAAFAQALRTAARVGAGTSQADTQVASGDAGDAGDAGGSGDAGETAPVIDPQQVPAVPPIPPPLPTNLPRGVASEPIPRPAPPFVPPAQRKHGAGRILVTALAALLLLIAIAGGAALAQQQQQQQAHADATQTSSAQTATARTQSTATATATATPASIFCTQPLQVTDDAPCVPPPPSQVSATPLLNDTAPDCDSSGVTWTSTNFLQKSCPDTGGTQIGTTALQTLACLDAESAVTSNGYVSVLVTSQSGNGSAVLAFRQGKQTTPGNGFVLTGYYFRVSPAQNSYLLYKYDGHATQRITSNSLPQLAQHFVMGVLFAGNHFTLYINGHEIGAGFEAQGTASTGWFGVCADSGAEVFKYALEYSSGS